MKNTNSSRMRVGIIGAGASGLTTAWLLDEHYDVTIFEKEDRLGGHVCTIPVSVNGKTINVEAGAEFFSDMMFNTFNKLLNVLKVRTRQFPLTYTFYNTNTDQQIVLPPIHNKTISWQSLKPHAIFDLTQLSHFINAGKNIIEMQDYDISLSDFADTLMLTQEFKDHFLYPFFAASWGTSSEEIKKFAAYDILKWALINEPANFQAAHWNEIEGGMKTYIDSLAGQLKNTQVTHSAEITDITYADNQYTLAQANGKKQNFDHIIIATNAEIAKNLLKNITHAQNLQSILGSIEYFYTTIAIHGDPRFMPANEADWSVANIRYDGVNSALTICKPWMKEAQVFRSWISLPVGVSAENAMPNPVYDVRHFYHPKANYSYFAAQKELAKLQGNHNLWIAGFYTHDTDSHNNAIVSAINIAQQLAPESERLKALTS